MCVYQCLLISYISETWTNEKCDLGLHLPGYNYMAIHRTIKKRGTVRDSGGLLLYIKSELRDAFLHNLKDIFLWIKLNGDKLGWDNDSYVYSLTGLGLCNVIPGASYHNLCNSPLMAFH